VRDQSTEKKKEIDEEKSIAEIIKLIKTNKNTTNSEPLN